MLRGLVWNCGGIGDSEKKKFIREQINKNSLDFVGIQETMKVDFHPLELSNSSAQEPFDWSFLPSKGKSGGILVGTNNNSLVKGEVELGEYFVKIKVSNVSDGFVWNLVIVYEDAQPTRKSKFLVELVHLFKNTKSPLLITGDFNITRKASDKNKPGGYNKWSVLFNSIISLGEMIELPLVGRKFT